MTTLSHASYGKANVRVAKVQRNVDGTQDITEMTVQTSLEGSSIAASWTAADNTHIVATDTQKHTVYVLAKQHPVNPPELFAARLATHFIDTYSWMDAAHVNITVHRWTRFAVDGTPHPHSFLRDGEDKRVISATARRGSGIELQSGMDGLLVLKTTGSQFWGFHRDEYTRLPETRDRILSTEVQAKWRWRKFTDFAAVEAASAEFNPAYESARKITLETFATEDSPSVQNTMYLMSQRILTAVPRVDAVDYTLPNKHYFEIDLSWFKGLKNLGADAEVYAPQSDPNGLIHSTVDRETTPPRL